MKIAFSASSAPLPATRERLLQDVRELIRGTRERVASAVNAGLVVVYWQVGRRIRNDILREKRAEYGQEIFSTLSRKLVVEFGQGFSQQNLFRMTRFADVFPEPKVVAALSRELGWSHFAEIIPLKEPLQREFYAEMCRIERWSVRRLREKIASMLFERATATKEAAMLARQEVQVPRGDGKVTPDFVFLGPSPRGSAGLSKSVVLAVKRSLDDSDGPK